MRPWQRRLLTLAVVVAVVAGLVVFLHSEPIAQWNSTATERSQPMVGDELVDEPINNWTRSITIDAPPEEIWPWLVQIGADKGGFYTYDWAEQMAGDLLHNASTIHPEWQDLRAGGEVHPFPNAKGYWKVAQVEPNRLLVLGDEKWTWTTELRPLAGGETRVVTRMRGAGNWTNQLLNPEDLIVFPRILVGLKQRAEGTLPGMEGTETGRPFPLARIPVHAWAAALWLLGLTSVGWVAARRLGLGLWGAWRPHAALTASLAFVAAAGYSLMSDTPPLHYVRHVWGLGVVVGVVAAAVLVRLTPAVELDAPYHHARWFPRATAAFAETGMFVVIPVTAVWQAATAQGWTSSLLEKGAIAAVAFATAAVVAGVSWRSQRGRARVLVPIVLAGAYAFSGSALAAFLAAVLYESLRRQRAIVSDVASPAPDFMAMEEKELSLVGGPQDATH